MVEIKKYQEIAVEDLLSEVINSFPILIEGNVYHCGFHSEHSYGASSYFIQRDDGNVLVDSPRFTNSLINKLKQMGGIKYLYLTHKDDVADHEKFKKNFNCKRIIHEDDITDDTKEVEISLQPVELKNVLREDNEEKCFTQEEALSLTEHKKDGYFKGPKAV